jgi:prolipoprotein diacylglyceryltransferase
LLGGLVGIELAKRALGWRLSTGDGFVVPLLAAMVIGRVGCQLSGLADLTYGNVTTLPWGWNYGDGRARHPTAFYEIFALLVITWVAYRPAFGAVRGDRFRAFFAGYLLVRFGLEFLKPPFGPTAAELLSPTRWGPFSAIQWACLAGLAYYARDIRRWIRPQDPIRA